MKLVCYNLNQRLQYAESRPAILKILQSLDADIICIQEIMKFSHVAWLAKQLNMYYDKNTWHKGGMAVISRVKIISTLNVTIKSAWYNALVGIQIDDGTWICSVHLTDLEYKKDETERLREAKFIIDNLPNAKKIIVAGDFNSPSHLDLTSEVKYASHLFHDAKFHDAQAGKLWTRSTWMPSKTKTIERIDRIYMKNITTKDGGIMDKADFKFLKSWPTGRDHRLIWVRF